MCAVTIRSAERDHGYHKILHEYVEQIERLLTIVVLILLGGAVARGLLAEVGWQHVALALAAVLLVRPLTGWVGLAGGKTGPRERGAIAYFGIRGIGSLYYLSYAIVHGVVGADADRLVGLTLWIVAISIVVHGVSVTPVMRRYESLRGSS